MLCYVWKSLVCNDILYTQPCWDGACDGNSSIFRTKYRSYTSFRTLKPDSHVNRSNRDDCVRWYWHSGLRVDWGKKKKNNNNNKKKTKRPSSNCLTCNRPFQLFFFNFFRGHVRENTSVDYVAKFVLLKTNGDKTSQSREILKTDVLVYGVGHKLAAQRTNFCIFSQLSGAISSYS